MEFSLVDKVAHAFKHVVTGPPQKPNPLKAAGVISRSPVLGLSRLAMGSAV
jgi:hypothetical protein